MRSPSQTEQTPISDRSYPHFSQIRSPFLTDHIPISDISDPLFRQHRSPFQTDEIPMLFFSRHIIRSPFQIRLRFHMFRQNKSSFQTDQTPISHQTDQTPISDRSDPHSRQVRPRFQTYQAPFQTDQTSTKDRSDPHFRHIRSDQVPISSPRSFGGKRIPDLLSSAPSPARSAVPGTVRYGMVWYGMVCVNYFSVRFHLFFPPGRQAGWLEGTPS